MSELRLAQPPPALKAQVVRPRAAPDHWYARVSDHSVPPPLRDDHPSILHARPRAWWAAFGWCAAAATVAAWLAAALHTTTNLRHEFESGRAGVIDVVALVAVLTTTAVLGFSAVTYLVIRAGALARLATHERADRLHLDAHFSGGEQTMTVLVPSYAEEPRVVRATLWSAALQEFPSLDVVLLLDDQPNPSDPGVRAKLDRTRALANEIQAELNEPARFLAGALATAEAKVAGRGLATGRTLSARRIEGLYRYASGWLTSMAAAEEVHDHVDEFFVDQVILALARDLNDVADEIRALRTFDLPGPLGLARIRRLVNIFSVTLDVFERKRYASLSHEANKAMNLNSYIGLMGQSWVEEEVWVGAHPLDPAAGVFEVLRECGPRNTPDRVVRAPDYILTLDADSLLVPDYCVRLVRELELPGNERVAVIQTPYSSYRGAPSALERVAGMITDLQHLQHQGRTAFDATFWVGANAVIRTAALDDIVEIRTEQGPAGPREIRTYIQDRTVIEDTESSMDLVAKGWSLHNYAERLSYSATPADFGSLVVQRRRWANGGLIIMPKVLEAVRGRRLRGERTRALEVLIRADYLGSIAWTTTGALLLLMIPTAPWLLSPLMFAIALPYFATMAFDLRYSGHRVRDVFAVFALNMVLLPVNVAGVLKSMEQAVTRRKIPFARTPKVADRVAAPAIFVLTPYLLGIVMFVLAAVAASNRHWPVLGFAALTGAAVLIGSVVFVGTRTALEDIVAALRQRMGR